MTDSQNTLTFPDGRPVPQFLTPTDVADLFGITRSSVYTAIRRNELYCRRFTARQFRIPREEAVRWFYGGEPR